MENLHQQAVLIIAAFGSFLTLWIYASFDIIKNKIKTLLRK